MRLRSLFAVVVAALVLSACSSGGGSATASKTVTLVTYDSWALPDDLVAQFEKSSGYQLKVVTAGDAGQLTNKLVLTQGDPLGDVSFGVDNTFLSRATDAHVFADTPTEIDHSAVCVDIDTDWFAAHHLNPPTGFDDLVNPTYKNLMVIPGASTSSPGLAFLLATIASNQNSDAWQTYWQDLIANGAEIVDSWDTAFYNEFTQGGNGGKRPIVVSYDTDPAFAVTDGKSPIKSLLGTCFAQQEYAGVLSNAKNSAGGQAFLTWLQSPGVQKALPENMYVFPSAPGIELPDDWMKFAIEPTSPLTMDPAVINGGRDGWLQEWTDIVTK